MEQTNKKGKHIIAVTGSAGKTTSKEMIAAILGKRWAIYKSPHNNNAPRATLGHVSRIRRTGCRAAVVEFGMRHFGVIKRHCKYLQPTIGVITNVGTAHMGNLGGSVKGVAKAKSEMIRNMKQTGTLLLNGDDPNSRLLSTKGFQGNIVKVGMRKDANYRAYDVRYTTKGMSFKLKLDGSEHTFNIPVFGKHNIYNAMFAIAIAHRLGFKPSQMKAGLRTYQRPNSRLRVHRLRGNVTVIDDAFSSNPDAAKAALDVLSNVGKQRKIAVLGTMNELGKRTAQAHEEVGKYAAGIRLTRLYTLGAEAKQIAAGARQAGMPSDKIERFVNKRRLQRALLTAMQPGTTMLIKGSHSLLMSSMVGFLKRRARARAKG